MRARNRPVVDKLTQLYRKGRRDLSVFRAKIQLVDAEDSEKLTPTWYHNQWSQELLYAKQSIACEGFRECGKSSVIKSFLLYCLTFPTISRSYIAIMRGNKTSASKIIREVAQDYLNNPLMYGASLDTVLTDNADSFSIKTRRGRTIRIEAYGKGSAIRGPTSNNRRPDVVILDDIQDKEDMRSPTIPDTDWDWFLSDIKFLGKETRFFFIGNNLGDKCIIERLINSADKDGKGLFGFQCYRIPAINKDGKSNWQERFSLEDLEAERKEMDGQGKLDIWLMERMCQAISPDKQIFKQEDWRYYGFLDAPVIRDRSNCFITIDPAISTRDESDYRAVCVNCVDEEDNWYIMDIAYGRWLPDEMWEKVFELVVEYKVKTVGIEEGVFKIMAEAGMGGSIYTMMKQKSVYFDLVPLKHGGTKKEIRIAESLSARFKAHSIMFPDQAGNWLEELKSEIIGFRMTGCTTLHDDLLDALAYQVQIAKKPYGRKRRTSFDSQEMEVDGCIL
jgi:predicted phage terminase large subunit-like protein